MHAKFTKIAIKVIKLILWNQGQDNGMSPSFSPTTSTFGGNNLYITGVTNRESNVELINPPMITQANGEYNGLFSMANGVKPPIAVREVNTIGTKRISPAFSMASNNGIPRSRSWLVKSTSKIEFFTSMPTNAIKPITATNDNGLPVINNILTAPITPNGITDKTINVLLKFPNSSTSTAINPKAVIIMMAPSPPKDSCLFSTSPAAT